MSIPVLNCGCSSVKYQLIKADSQKWLAKGSVDRIGMSGATLKNTRHDGDEITIAGEIVDHIVAIEYILAVLLSRNHGVINDKSDIHAIGHRVVHGGETFTSSVLITGEVINASNTLVINSALRIANGFGLSVGVKFPLREREESISYDILFTSAGAEFAS
jgi:acetate kinase